MAELLSLVNLVDLRFILKYHFTTTETNKNLDIL